MQANLGLSLRLNVPEFFADEDFMAWLNNGIPKFTWHQGGEEANEYSDVIVLVDPSLNGEGSGTDMPEDFWSEIVSECRTHYGDLIGVNFEAITVRLTNLSD